ncbi:MAG TPA: transglycosylase SLT domain-containing protein [Vulgatibacter sp.]|nr:transglycosylase SLT domain-containing protein [Vulgatibacter sp.]
MRGTIAPAPARGRREGSSGAGGTPSNPPRGASPLLAAALVAAAWLAPATSLASAPGGLDEDLRALHELEAREIERGAIAIDRMLHRLGDTNPWSRRLRGSLGAGLDGWPDIVDPGEIGGAFAGSLPFSIESVAGAYDIPVEYNESVAEYLAFFQGPGRRWFARWLERSHRWVPLFREILRSHGMPEDLVYLSMIESGFSMHAKSWASAVGPWQFIEATGRRFGLTTDFWVDERKDPVKSTRAAAEFLRRLHDAWGDWYLAWAGYNAGPGRVSKAIARYGTEDFWELAATDDAFRKETRHYVPKLIAAALIAKHPEKFGFTELTPEAPLEWEIAQVPDATDLEVIAACAGVTVEEITALNPELRQWATPPVPKGAPPYELRLPKGKAQAFAAAYAKVKPSERFTFRSYKVQKGDTLGHIALMFSTNVKALMKANRGLDPRRLRIGQELVIPIPPGARGPQTASRR